MDLLIGMIAGAVGGNAAGGLMKNLNLGVLGNSVAGILGGGLGSQILSLIGVGGLSGSSADLAGIIAPLVTGGVGGGALLAVVGAIRNALGK